MSGICGIIYFDGKKVKKEEIHKMLDAMQNRGNDTEGIWIADHVGFAHKMLWTTSESLYDNQPKVSQNGDLIITADARIDNREELVEKLEIDESEFSVITDTDLIMWSYEKWGEKCPAHLLGDFSFAIFDKKNKTFFFAKDHIGIRPFYYYYDEHIFCFSSEISILFSISSIERQINESAIETFEENMTLGYEDTFFKNIKRLPPAHKMILDDKDINLTRYWFPEQLKINKEISFKNATKKFKELLEEAIVARLRSVYPIGCELSGGLDSSSILSLSARLNSENEMIPFSQRYGNLDCDESFYSDLVAESLGMNIQTVRVDKLDYREKYSLKKYFQLFPDWPTYGSFMGLIPIAKKAQGKNIRILLTGQGGDHIVAGNLYMLADYLKTYQFIKLYKELKYYQWSKKIIKNYVIKPILPKIIFKLKNFLRSKKRKTIRSTNSFLDNRDSNISLSSIAIKEDLDSLIGTFNALWTDSNPYHNIEKFNVESRHPFFDVRLIEFCLSLPEEYKLQYGQSKMILKEAMRGHLPEDVRSRNDKAEFSSSVEIQLSSEKSNMKLDKIHDSILKKSIKIGILKWKQNFFREKNEKNSI